jgi:hypothetical protein
MRIRVRVNAWVKGRCVTLMGVMSGVDRRCVEWRSSGGGVV